MNLAIKINSLSGYDLSTAGVDQFLTRPITSQLMLREVATGLKFLTIAIGEEPRPGYRTVFLVAADDGPAKDAFAHGKITYRQFIEMSQNYRIGSLNTATGDVQAKPASLSDLPSGLLEGLERANDFVTNKAWHDERAARYAKRFG